MIYETLSKIAQTKPREHWLTELQARDVPCAPINNLAEVFEDPQVQFLDRLMKVEDPEFGVFQLVKNGVNFSETPAALTLRPPKLGEHNEAILKTLGYSAEEIQDLKEKRIL